MHQDPSQTVAAVASYRGRRAVRERGGAAMRHDAPLVGGAAGRRQGGGGALGYLLGVAATARNLNTCHRLVAMLDASADR